MFRSEKITSNQNPKIKQLLHLQKHKERLLQNLFIIEGIKEIEKAVVAELDFDSLFYCSDLIEDARIHNIFKDSLPGKVFEISRELFNKVAYRQDSGGLILLARPKILKISQIDLPENPLILVLEGVEKPGNIGAIFRTADAAGISAIIICDPATDLFNPNVIRASLGCVFTIPAYVCESKDAITVMKEKNIKIFTSYLQASVPYHTVDYRQPSAIVMGTEATGVSMLWLDAAEKNIIIPMKGEADSMNVSTAAAVLIFEACRQRGFI